MYLSADSVKKVKESIRKYIHMRYEHYFLSRICALITSSIFTRYCITYLTDRPAILKRKMKKPE